LATMDEVERTCEKAEEPELKMKKGKKAEVGDLVSFTVYWSPTKKTERTATHNEVEILQRVLTSLSPPND